MNRRASLLAVGALTVLGGCQSGGVSSYKQFFDVLHASFQNGLGNARVTREQAAAIPYASLGYRVGDGPELLLVLATENDAGLLWTSAEHVVIVTRQGRVVRSVGFAHDLGASAAGLGSDLPALSTALQGPSSYKRYMDFPDIGVYGAALSCRLSSSRPETIKILGSAVQTVKILESCAAPSLKWSFTNTYWIDRDGALVWRSIQYIHPRLPELHVEIFRPPG